METTSAGALNNSSTSFAATVTDAAGNVSACATPITYVEDSTALGDLTPEGCIDDNDTGADTCAQSADGMRTTSGIAVSPDGKSVYTASQDDSAIARFDRDPNTGALTPQGCIEDNEVSPDVCAQHAPGLKGATAIDVSDDGNDVYVAAYGPDLLLFNDGKRFTDATARAGLGDPALTKWAETHKAIVDRFGRFPHRNAALGRDSTPEEVEFLKQAGSSF